MDWIIFSSLSGSIIPAITFSYDICCQWSRNLKTRIKQLPNHMQLTPEVLHLARYVVPKFHIYNHGPKCQTQYSMNFLSGMGRFNGEDPERWWAHINPLSMSTKEMSSGSRTDTIDDHVRAWNWRKIINFGSFISVYLRERTDFVYLGHSLHDGLENASEMYVVHQQLFDEFSATFPPETVAAWEQMVIDWEADMTKPNPYEEPAKGESQCFPCHVHLLILFL